MPAPHDGYAFFDIATFRSDFTRIRMDRGITQEEVALDINIGTTTINNFERGAYSPSLTVFAKLVAWSGLEPSDYIHKEHYEP